MLSFGDYHWMVWSVYRALIELPNHHTRGTRMGKKRNGIRASSINSYKNRGRGDNLLDFICSPAEYSASNECISSKEVIITK